MHETHRCIAGDAVDEQTRECVDLPVVDGVKHTRNPDRHISASTTTRPPSPPHSGRVCACGCGTGGHPSTAAAPTQGSIIRRHATAYSEKEPVVSRFFRPRVAVAALALLLLATACGRTPGADAAPTVEEASRFLETVDSTLKRVSVHAAQAGWVAQNFITIETEAIDARATQAEIETLARFAKESTRFDRLTLPERERRQLHLLKLSLVMATPQNPAEAEELTKLVSSMRSAYGRGRFCPEPGRSEGCLNIDDITKIMATSRN